MSTFFIILTIVFIIVFISSFSSNGRKTQTPPQQNIGDKLIQQERDKLTKLTQIQATMEEQVGKTKGLDVIDLKNGNMLVKRTYLNANFMEGAIISDDILFSIEDKEGYVTVPKKDFDLMCIKRDSYRTAKERLEKTAILNNKGMELEKSNKTDEAIAVYEECVKLGYPALHSYDRLLVIYRRNKDYDNEKRICKLAVEKFNFMPKYAERLSKIEKLIEKKAELEKLDTGS